MMTAVLISAHENMSYGVAALYALVGFLIVVAVLALLVGIFYLSGAIFRTKALSKDKLFERKKKQKVQPTDAVEISDETDDGELVAAITAAISVILAEESDETDMPDFVIRRVTRKK